MKEEEKKKKGVDILSLNFSLDEILNENAKLIEMYKKFAVNKDLQLFHEDIQTIVSYVKENTSLEMGGEMAN